MVKVFISQPMKGRTDDEILAERQSIIDKLPADAEVIDSYIKDGDDDPLKLLGQSLERMADADMVVFAENWHFNRGCKIEHEAAYRYCKKVKYASDLLS